MSLLVLINPFVKRFSRASQLFDLYEMVALRRRGGTLSSHTCAGPLIFGLFVRL